GAHPLGDDLGGGGRVRQIYVGRFRQANETDEKRHDSRVSLASDHLPIDPEPRPALLEGRVSPQRPKWSQFHAGRIVGRGTRAWGLPKCAAPFRRAAGNELHFSCVVTLALSVDGFLAYLSDERRFSPRTIEAYRSDLERFLSFWSEEFANLPAAK